MLLGIIFAFTDFTGGEMGVSGLDRISTDNNVDYYISLVVMTVSVFVMWKLTDAKSSFIRTGIIFHAIREDEIAARASGINTIRYKLLAFIVAGFFAGIAGAFSAHFMRIAGPSSLDLFFSFQAIIWTVFGGICSIYGPVVGVYVLHPLMEFLRVVPEVRILIFAGIVVVMLLFMPEGIAVWVRDKIERECPRCKLSNVAFRKTCRACSTRLYEQTAD
jgi:branched-chain amino acid transport system permease protein